MHRVHELVVAGAGPIAGSDPSAAAAMLRLGAVAGWWAGDAKLVQDAADRMTGLAQNGLIPGPGALQAMADLLAGGLPRRYRGSPRSWPRSVTSGRSNSPSGSTRPTWPC